MKQIRVFILLFCMGFLSACQKTTYFEYKPVGYGIINHEYVARASFSVTTKDPNLLNAFSLSVVFLPEYIGEIKVTDIASYDPLDPSLLILPSHRVYAKYLYVGTKILEGRIEGYQVYYYTEEGIRMLDYLAEEEHAKWYFEALRSNDAYMLDHERVMMTTHIMKTKTDEYSSGFSNERDKMIMVFYEESGQTSLPNYSSLFAIGDYEKMNVLFMRAYQHRFNEAFKVYEWTE